MTLEQQCCSKRIPWNKGKRGYHMPLRGGGYSAIHRWLGKHFGKAIKCEGKICSRKSSAYYWALKKGKRYEHNRNNFFQLCASCHRLYDKTEEWIEKIRATSTGRKHSITTKKKISIRLMGVHKGNAHAAIPVIQMDLNGRTIKNWQSATDAAKHLGISKSGITMACRGDLKKSGNFLWKYLNR